MDNSCIISRHVATYNNRLVRVVINVDEEIKNPIRDFKILVDKDTEVSRLLGYVRRRLVLEKEEAIFMFTGGCLASMSDTVGELFIKNKDKKSNTLTFLIKSENAFGN